MHEKYRDIKIVDYVKFCERAEFVQFEERNCESPTIAVLDYSAGHSSRVESASLVWAQLPEQMAIHFGTNGEANQWMSRTGATALSCGLVIGLPLFFTVIPIAVRRLPTSTINIPYREYG